MLARLRQLAALLLDLAEQPRILDRQHRLVGECFEKIDRALGKFAGLFSSHHQYADYLARANETKVPVYWTPDDVAHHRARAATHLVLTLPEFQLN